MRIVSVFAAFMLAFAPFTTITSAESQIDLGRVLRGSHKTLAYAVKFKGDVSLAPDRLWIQVDKARLKAPGTVKITIKASLLPKGTDHSGLISVRSGSKVVETIKIAVSTEKTIELKMKIYSRTATLNGRTLQVKHPMRMKGCSPLVPLRFVCDILGATTLFNPKDSSIKIYRLDRVIEILPDVEEFTVNGKSKISNPAPAFYDGAMFVPLGLISTAFGICVDWDRVGEQGNIRLCD